MNYENQTGTNSVDSVRYLVIEIHTAGRCFLSPEAIETNLIPTPGTLLLHQCISSSNNNQAGTFLEGMRIFCYRNSEVLQL